MTDEEREAQSWVGDESRIREQHERDRRAQHMTGMDNPHGATIGTNPSVNPYTFAKVEVLLLRLDEARAEKGPVERGIT